MQDESPRGCPRAGSVQVDKGPCRHPCIIERTAGSELRMELLLTAPDGEALPLILNPDLGLLPVQ